MMKKKAISLLIVTILFCSLIFTACGEKLVPEVITYDYAIREEATVDTPEYDDDFRVLPKAEKETKKEIQYIDLNGQPWSVLMMMTTLQGNVNRVEPSMYILHHYVIEGVPEFNAPTFCFF